MNSFQHFRMAEQYAATTGSAPSSQQAAMMAALAHATMAQLAWQVETAQGTANTDVIRAWHEHLGVEGEGRE